MIDRDLIERINYLAWKKKHEGLTAEEAEEQKKLRDIYLRNIRQQVKASLDALKQAQQGQHKNKEHGHGCNCHHCKN
ncbi:hypothetical protein Tfer_2833 [Thermincola ferriacetica]|uniref:UPF0291 protein Tfer_2833 n=1 Tax=Thermincola ferriacetica TaxID=281456 RepID=A0A0L6VZE2_9FIRM|nr:DUF896 domain-containing protein [Thermincola ferriacetica]KNZ68581.1 hypothetical protein Tfer_2833 [Thermincola ferriacetica]